MARKRPQQDPRERLSAAVTATFGEPTKFFNAVADAAKIAAGTAKGTYFAFLRTNESSRGLPVRQRAAYLRLLPISADLLDEIEATRPQEASTRRGRDRLEELAKSVAEILKNQEAGLSAIQEIRALLEPGDGAAQVRPRRRPR